MASVDLLSDAEWLSVSRERLRADGDSGTADGHLRLLEVRPAAANGEFAGFVADSLPIRARVQVCDGAEKELAFFLKTIPRNDDVHARMARDAFVKEVGLYTDVFPRMREFPSRDKMAPGTSPWAPRTFFARPGLLVMEDLMQQGFVELDRRKSFDFEHVAKALEAVAHFHASAFLFEEERGRQLGRFSPFNQLFPDLIDELLFVDVPKNQIGRWFGGAVRGLRETVKLISKYKQSSEYGHILDSFPKVHLRMVDLVRPSTKYRNVLNHGDLWSNNIMFRYSEDGRPVEVRLLDFQLARYCPPAVDIVTLLHLTTRPVLRWERGGELLQRYHTTLADSLQRGGVDVQRILSWEELVASCDEYHDAGRIITPSYHHISLTTPEVLKKQVSPENFEQFFFEERREIVEQCFQNDQYYREKVSEELCELVDSVIFGKNTEFWKRAAAAVR